ncbi:putative ribonuclease H-like domain-containing protein [Tanacetum coccineum]
MSLSLEEKVGVDAMQEELLQFKIQKVWILVDLPFGKKTIGIKWVYRNKKDERGVVVRNKEMIESIRIFLAFASYMGFIVYQMDVKSALLYGTIDEEVYVSQHPGFVEPIFPKKSGYRRGTIDKTLFIEKDRNDIINVDEQIPDDFYGVKTANTPIETQKPLIKDEEAADVDVHLYRSMIGSLMYLTASRAWILCMQSVLVLVSVIMLDNLDRKSTTGGCQFLGRRLISWQCKKQTIMATFTTEAEYVAAANCYGQVLWVQNQLLDYGFNFMNTKIYIDNKSTICIVKNPVFHSKTKHIEIRHHFIRDAYEKKLIQMLKIYTDDNVDLLYSLENDVEVHYVLWGVAIESYICGLPYTKLDLLLSHSKVAGKTVSISEASIRRDLLFNDVDGIDCLTNQEIYENLQLMGSKSTSWDQFPTNIASALICLATDRKFNFSKMIFEGMIRNLDAKKQFLMYPRFVQVFLNNQLSNLPAPLDNLPIPVLTKKVFTNMAKQGLHFSGHVTPLFPNMLAQAVVDEGEGSAQPTEPQPTPSPTQPNTRDQPSMTESSYRPDTTHTLGAEGGLNLDELLVLCTNLSNMVLTLETSKEAQAVQSFKLKMSPKYNPSPKPSMSRSMSTRTIYTVVEYDRYNSLRRQQYYYHSFAPVEQEPAEQEESEPFEQEESKPLEQEESEPTEQEEPNHEVSSDRTATLKYCDKHNQVGFLKKPEESAGFAEIVDFLKGSHIRYALTHNPTIHDSLVKQFWQTATASTLADGTLELRATIDTLEYTITEASVRSKLQLADASGISMLPNTEIFEGMGNMGYPTDGSFTFWKSFFTPQWRFFVHHILHCISPKSGGWDQFGSNIATALICLSTGRVYNFSKLIFDGMVANLKSKTKFLMYPRFLQMILEIQTENKHPYLAVALTKKIFGNMKRGFRGVPRPLLPAMLPVVDQSAGPADQAEDQPSSSEPLPSTSHPTPVAEPTPVPEPTTHPTSPSPEPDNEPTEHTFDQPSTEHQPLSPRQEPEAPQSQYPSHPHVPEARSLTAEDLLHMVPTLITKVDSLETELKQTKQTMGKAIVKLVKKVKKLENILKRRNVVLTTSEDEEPEDQGRIFKDIDDDPLVSFVTPTKPSGEAQEEEISPTTLEAAKTLSKVASQRSKSVDKGKRYKRRKEFKGKDFEDISTGFEEVNTGGLGFSTGSGPVSSDRGQREGKAPMIIEETQAPKRTKEQIQQEEASLAEAIRLQNLEEEETAKQVHLDALLAKRLAEEEELTEQQKQRKAQVQFEAQHYTEEDWDAIRAKLEANAELAKSVIAKDMSEEDFAKRMVDLVNQRKKYFAEEKAKAKRNKPMTQSQLRIYMSNYLKNQGTWKLSQLKKLKFNEIKEEFDKLVKQVDTFVPIDAQSTEEKEKEPVKKMGKRRKQIARKGLHTAKDEAKKDEASEEDDSSSAMLDKKLQGDKKDEACYKLLKLIEKQAGIKWSGL